MHAATYRLMAASATVLLLLGACESGDVDYAYPEKVGRDQYDPSGRTQQNTVFGPGGLSLLGGNGDADAGGSGGGIGVNSFLWRASLDTISFMPLASADPFGGVIITDWYTPPATPEERFKMTVYILDRTLRSDGVRVAVFRQRRDGSDWLQQPVAADTASNLENAILVRARQLRIDQAGG
ncbi:MAG: DUF3576 domain-containing protein [Sneathiellaceae bacterium]